MGQNSFFNLYKLISITAVSLIVASCGSYQYSSYNNDGIYSENKRTENSPVVADTQSKEENNSDYYKSVFSEKNMMYSENETSEELFTDVENYSNIESDSLAKNYGPWGEYKDSVVINIHSHHHDGFWSKWRYPNWMWNYGFGYGNVWGYGYNNYWSRPFPLYGGMYDPFNPFWGYYDSFYYGYGYGYGYGYNPFWRPYNSWYNNSPYGRINTPISIINGRRGSRNAISSRLGITNPRANSLSNKNIRDRFNRSGSNSLSKKLSRIDKINSSARVNPNYYNKPFNSAGSSNSLSKPRNENNNSSKPRGNYSKPSNNNYKPSSKPNYSRPSYSRPSNSSSSYSRGGGSNFSSGSSSSSRGGKSGR